jgi:hypothetical protein
MKLFSTPGISLAKPGKISETPRLLLIHGHVRSRLIFLVMAMSISTSGRAQVR